jgi:hypothetical protein
MFMLTNALATKLRDDLRERPLADHEIRRIVGMGPHYITAKTTDVSTRGMMTLFTVIVDDREYWVVKPDPARPPGGE